jgi:ankyrin repeat protein
VHWAVENERDDVVVALCTGGGDIAGVSPNLCNSDGWSALHWAARADRVELVGFLVERGALLESRTSEGHTPLHIAAMHGSGQAACVLLHFGSDETAHDQKESAWTALHWAAANGHRQLVEPLLTAAVRSAIDPAAAATLAAALRDRLDGDGWSPLHRAAAAGHARVIAALLEAEADIEGMHRSSGRRALHVAAIEGRAEVVRLLLDCQADASAADSAGQTALDLALKGGWDDVVLLMDPDHDLELDMGTLGLGTAQVRTEIPATPLSTGAAGCAVRGASPVSRVHSRRSGRMRRPRWWWGSAQRGGGGRCSPIRRRKTVAEAALPSTVVVRTIH